MDNIRSLRGRFNPWAPHNPLEFSPADKSQSEGNGERMLAWELANLGVMKNPNGENAFPDLLLADGSPFGEVKAVGKKATINMGRHTDFADRVREMVYVQACAGKMLEFKTARKILGGYIGVAIMQKLLTVEQWNSIQKDFVKDYIQKAGGNVFFVSEEGWTVIDTDTWSSLKMVAVTTTGITCLPDRNVRPFAKD